jgi:hypothetical protein
LEAVPMNLELHVVETNNGFIVRVENTVRNNGVYVFRSVDDILMLEFLGKVVLDKNVSVERK